jgi:hypothetical protein
MGNLSPSPIAYTETHQTELLLRGLPWKATIPELVLFLLAQGFQASEADVRMCTDKRNRFNGRATAQCKSFDDAIIAQSAVHGAMWGKRYIEAFMRSRSSRTWSSEFSCDSQFGSFGQTP